MIAAASVWSPWSEDDAEAEAEATDCVEDATHLIDDEAGVCYIIPDDWALVTPEVAEEHGLENYESTVHAPRFAATVMTTAHPYSQSETDAEESARSFVSGITGVDYDSPSVEWVTGAVDGHDSAIAIAQLESIWFMVTTIEDGDKMIKMLGTVVSGEQELIAQVQSIQSSVRLK
ncbi:hypothetical protein [Glycomyces rhizosphaerae]|uniref:Uncharacterized protein n=1 Tax=Glycomyces rhizosphaerae TaxID=2054422 RepID=A0ABV7Q2W0_9ACTN